VAEAKSNGKLNEKTAEVNGGRTERIAEGVKERR
jgi:hypothetical protein|tara:strand:+ start:825 stop:926 length:102 start_codon:yes stop_codon:yes gene_type:complete